MPEDGSCNLESAVLALAATVLSCVGIISFPTTEGVSTPFDDPDLVSVMAVVVAATLFIMITMALISIHLLCNAHLLDATCVLPCVVFSGSCLLVLLLIANIQALRYEDHVASHGNEYGAKLNNLVCDLRATQVCSAGNSFDEMAGIVASTTNLTTSTLETETRARDYCTIKLLRGPGSLSSSEKNFLASFTITVDVDKWCGRKAMNLPTSTASPFSPVSMNPAKYHSLQTKLPKHLRIMSIFLGAALVCMALLCFLERSDKQKIKQADRDFSPVADTKKREMA